MKRVLIVTEDPQTQARWSRALGAAGHRVEVCGGPSVTPCPRLGAGTCSLREIADVAVVELQRPGGLPYGETGEHACTAIGRDSPTIFIADDDVAWAGRTHLHHPVSDDTLLFLVGERLRDDASDVEPVASHPGDVRLDEADPRR